VFLGLKYCPEIMVYRELQKATAKSLVATLFQGPEFVHPYCKVIFPEYKQNLCFLGSNIVLKSWFIDYFDLRFSRIVRDKVMQIGSNYSRYLESNI